MPLGTMSADSTELVGYLVTALWIVTGLCAMVVTTVLTFFFLTAKAVKQAKRTVPELHQFGVAKDPDELDRHSGLEPATAR